MGSFLETYDDPGSLYISGKLPLGLCRVQRGHIVVLDDSPVTYRENKIGNDFLWGKW